MTLEEKFTGEKPSVDHLKIFGCIAFCHIPKEHCKKMDDKSQQCFFVGYNFDSNVYRLYNPHLKKIILSMDVVIDESKVGFVI